MGTPVTNHVALRNARCARIGSAGATAGWARAAVLRAHGGILLVGETLVREFTVAIGIRFVAGDQLLLTQQDEIVSSSSQAYSVKPVVR